MWLPIGFQKNWKHQKTLDAEKLLHVSCNSGALAAFLKLSKLAEYLFHEIIQ